MLCHVHDKIKWINHTLQVCHTCSYCHHWYVTVCILVNMSQLSYLVESCLNQLDAFCHFSRTKYRLTVYLILILGLYIWHYAISILLKYSCSKLLIKIFLQSENNMITKFTQRIWSIHTSYHHHIRNYFGICMKFAA